MYLDRYPFLRREAVAVELGYVIGNQEARLTRRDPSLPTCLRPRISRGRSLVAIFGAVHPLESALSLSEPYRLQSSIRDFDQASDRFINLRWINLHNTDARMFR